MKTITFIFMAAACCFSSMHRSEAQTGTWQYLDPMPFPRGFAASAVLNNKIYMIGGVYNVDLDATSTVLAFDPVMESWDSKIANLPIGLARASAEVLGGRIYVTGGHRYSAPEALKGTYLYDPETNTWMTKANMNKPRFYHEMAVVGNWIYAIGGRSLDWNAIDKTVERYSPETDSWQYVASMHKGRGAFSAEVIEGKIYVMGGADGSTVLSDVEMYDPETDTWTVMTNMPGTRWGHGSCFHDNQIYLFGGPSGLTLPGVWTWDVTGDWIETDVEMSDTVACFTYGIVDVNDTSCLYAIGGVSLYYWLPGSTGPYTSTAVRKLYPETVSVAQTQADPYMIVQAFPNPFLGSVTISYTLYHPGNVLITLYDVTGNTITVPYNGAQSAGEHTTIWNADGVPPGVYICQVETDGFRMISKLICQQ